VRLSAEKCGTTFYDTGSLRMGCRADYVSSGCDPKRDLAAQLALARCHHRCQRIRAHSNGTATPECRGITRAV
jgi:hypothetical protein